VTFACESATLVGTIDAEARASDATTGLLLVTGGNELRSGAFAGQAQFAARLSTEGFAVFRFDRRGVGDSDGPNGGFTSSAPDIAAALAAFRRECPHLTRVVGLGNCDAASALMLAKGAGLDALVLSNPWTIELDDAAPPPAAVRDHYKRRLADPKQIVRLLTGQVSLGKLIGSLRDALKPAPPPTGLAQDMKNGIAGFTGPVRFLIADRDRTAQAFLAAWDASDTRIHRCPGASHSYVEPEARAWLVEQVREVLRG
jgi:exosortase A-associated hydrolase 1